ncbi:MAG: MBL fold metallo-hydrolase, partial [Elusimicrobia bacterium]|nr:MBL fold metallo-hydrolase [Elusimicrobiota bacterium]
MKLRLLRCATMCPFGGRLPASLLPPRLTCNVLLVEAPSGLVLVDTGVGEADLADPSRLGPVSRLLGLAWLPELTARRQVEALGHKASDVRHILVTHLDLDHAGGLPDFPGATVHLLEAERAAALA